MNQNEFNFARGVNVSSSRNGSQRNIAISASIPNIVNRYRRLTEGIFGNLDAGTEFDDRLFAPLDAGLKIDLLPEQIKTGQRLSLLLYQKNVRAFGAIELIKDFVLGDGIRFTASDSKVQAILDEHWRENQWTDIIEERVRALAIFGEQLYPIFINDKTGMVKISSISPFFITRVLRDPENAERLKAVEISISNSIETAEPEIITFN